MKKENKKGKKSPLAAAVHDQTKQRRRSRQQRAIRHMAALAEVHLSEAQLKKTRAYLRSRFRVQAAQFQNSQKVWPILAQRAERQAMMRISREKYLEVITLVYSAYTVLASSMNKNELIEHLCATLGVRPSKKHDPIALTARIFINYGEDKGETAKKRAQVAWSRDAGAIKWLHSQKVAPHEVIEYQRKNGGGLVSWYRAWVDHRSKKPPKVTSAKAKVGVQEIQPSSMGLTLSDDAVLMTVAPDKDAPAGFRIIDRIVLPELPEKLINNFLLPRIRNLVNQAVELRTHNLAAMQNPKIPRWEEYPDFTEDELEFPR
jgi:hypothetical protein